jgi:superoxide dismutase, Cu-Zn family
MRHAWARSVVAALVVSACARRASVSSPAPTIQPPSQPVTPPPVLIDVRASATINDVANTTIGTATFADTPAGLLISISVSGLGIGAHGVHLHAIGQCATPAFASAGAHFNPGGKVHGFLNSAGHHAGDLPNIVSPPAGVHRVQFIVDGLKLTGRGGLLDDDGASIVIHGSEDDYATDPAGNSGGRIACGVIKMTK